MMCILFSKLLCIVCTCSLCLFLSIGLCRFLFFLPSLPFVYVKADLIEGYGVANFFLNHMQLNTQLGSLQCFTSYVHTYIHLSLY